MVGRRVGGGSVRVEVGLGDGIYCFLGQLIDIVFL